MKYRQAFLAEPYKFIIKEVEAEPKGDELLVKISSCGLCNWELNFWSGKLNFLGYPHSLGHEWAGVVAQVGPDVKSFAVGDKVSGFAPDFGGFAEYKAISETVCQKLGDTIDPKYAMGEPQKCVVTVLRAIAPEAGDVGVVLGCGPMGLWCTQALAGQYLEKLIAADIDETKLAMAKTFGATHTINTKSENVSEVITAITGGRLADFVIEGTGIPALLNEAQHYLKTTGRGKLAMMSSHSSATSEFDFRIAMDKCLQITSAHPSFSHNQADDFRRAVSLINNGTFKNKEMVSHEFALDDIQAAFEALDNKPADFIKGIVVCE